MGALAFRLSGLPKVVVTDTNRSATYDFLSVIHSNREPISYHFLDKRRDFGRKLQNFPLTPQVFNAPR